MPTYEYRCPEGHEFERFYRKMSDAASELPCPQCGKEAVRLLSGGAGLVFKGSGFYLTDYGKNAHRKGGPEGGSSGGAASSSSESSGSSSSGGESKSSAKPASESTAKSGEAKPAAPAPSPKSPKSDS